MNFNKYNQFQHVIEFSDLEPSSNSNLEMNSMMDFEYPLLFSPPFFPNMDHFEMLSPKLEYFEQDSMFTDECMNLPSEKVFDAATMRQLPYGEKGKGQPLKEKRMVRTYEEEIKQHFKNGKKEETIEALVKAEGRLFKCKHQGCLKRFKRMEHLKRHFISIHTNNRPHKCTFPECNKEFARSDNLKQHLKVHYNNSSYMTNVKVEGSINSVFSLDLSNSNDYLDLMDPNSPSNPDSKSKFNVIYY
ncbi:hypothetical protein K502DRAFT_301061 [Neoconidiobolus thromboides FSU 785]|nr:hypothetical protein K502DRAFT_301061 [Neoconidiobolus thromboides FSU 785]